MDTLGLHAFWGDARSGTLPSRWLQLVAGVEVRSFGFGMFVRGRRFSVVRARGKNIDSPTD